MSTTTAGAAPFQMLPGFFPLESLWAEDRQLFPSEQSARWFVRQQRQPLIDAKAIAIHRGRTMIHIERLLQVAEAQALKAAQ